MSVEQTVLSSSVEQSDKKPDALVLWIKKNKQIIFELLRRSGKNTYKVDRRTIDQISMEFILITPEGAFQTNKRQLYTRKQLFKCMEMEDPHAPAATDAPLPEAIAS